MNSYPQIVVQIHGTTTAPKKAQDELTRYFERPEELGRALDPKRDVRMIMDRLAHNRAWAVCYALQERGVGSDRMYVTSKGAEGEMKVDFIPDEAATLKKAKKAHKIRTVGGLEKRKRDGDDPDVLKGLLVTETFEVRVSREADGWDPVRAELVEGEAHRFVVEPTRNDVVLLMQPLAGRVDAVVENDVPGRPLPPGLKYEVRHRELQAVVCQGTLPYPATPTSTITFPLHHTGALFVGEQYVLSVVGELGGGAAGAAGRSGYGGGYGAASAAAQVTTRESMDFAVEAERTTRVRLRLHAKEAKLRLNFVSSKLGRALPTGVAYSICELPNEGGRTLLEGRTDEGGPRVPVQLDRPTTDVAPAWALGSTYVLHVADGGEGGVAPLQLEFTVDQEAFVKEVPLQLQALKGELRIKWIGPMAGQVERDVVGDGDYEPPPAASAEQVLGLIPFGVKQLERQRWVLDTYKDVPEQTSHAPRETPEDPPNPGTLYREEEYVLTTVATENWASVTRRFTLTGRTLEIELPMRRGEQAAGAKISVRYDASALRDQQAGRVPLPQGLACVIRPVVDEVGASRGGHRRDDWGRPVALAFLDAQGNGTIPRGTLQAGRQYTCTLLSLRELADTERGVPVMVTDAMTGQTHGMRRTLRLGDAALGPRIQSAGEAAVQFDEDCHERFVEPETFGAFEVVLTLRRRARDVLVHVLTPDDASAAGRALEVHHQMSGAFVANGATDSSGVCRLGMPLLIGEAYVLIVRATPATAELRHAFLVEPAQAYGGRTEAQRVEVRLEPSFPQWPDHRPLPYGAQQQAEADAQTVHSALRGLSTDYTKIEHVLSGRTSEQLELLCREYQRRDPRQRQLHDDLRSSGSAMKARSKVTKLEQLLVRPKAHLDAIMVRSALQGRPEGSRTFVPSEIVDVLCTSMPHALRDLRVAYRRLYAPEGGADAVDAPPFVVSQHIRQALAAGPSGAHKDDSPVPLLTGLIEGADEAMRMSNPQQVGQDVQALYGALHSGYTEADGRAMILRILTCRSRAHLREIDAVYGGTQGGALKAALSERFKGGLRRGVLLLFERSEVYYARKLHAAFHGTKKTKGLERGALLGGSTKTLGDRMQAGGLYTHDDTLVAVVASRYGRDLAGIADAYRAEYDRTLLEELAAHTHLELRRLLSAIVRDPLPRVDHTAGMAAGR